MFPKPILVGLVVRSPGAIPIPESVRAAALASVAKVILAFAPPALEGAKRTLKLALCPTAKVKGVARPLTLYPAPLTVTCLTVMLDPPALVREPDWVWRVPIGTLPKPMVDGARASSPGAGLCEDFVLNP